ncbi:MAG: glycosyltransferase [Polyangia bacterium]
MAIHHPLIITATLDIGGLESYLVRLLETIDRSRFAPAIMYEGRGEDAYLGRLAKMDIPIVRRCYGKSIFGFLARFERLVEEHSVDIVCDFRGDMAGPVLRWAKKLGVASRVAMYRNAADKYERTYFNMSAARFFNGLVLGSATAITGNTSAVLDYHFQTKKKWRKDGRFQVVHNGVDLAALSRKKGRNSLRQELGIGEREYLIGHVGRFVEEKNHEGLISSFELVSNLHPQARLVMIGDGALRPEIEKLVEELGLKEKVVFAGTRKEVHEMLAGLDAFVFPSKSEGMPNALVEAMAAGLPFVASNIAQIKEIVPKEMWGQLADSADVDGMAARICKMIEQPGRAEKIGKRAEEWAEKQYSIQQSVEKMTDLWVAPLSK